MAKLEQKLRKVLNRSKIILSLNCHTHQRFNKEFLSCQTLSHQRISCSYAWPNWHRKSLNCSQLLSTGLSDSYQYISLAFSAQTSPNQTQDTIDSKMEKRRKGYYGPPIGKKCIIFIDDLNMPKKQTYGAQPPIELIRQFLDHKSWYDRKTLSLMKLQDLLMLCTMGPPGGGRTFITNRIIRHFNILALYLIIQ